MLKDLIEKKSSVRYLIVAIPVLWKHCRNYTACSLAWVKDSEWGSRVTSNQVRVPDNRLQDIEMIVSSTAGKTPN